MFALVEWNRETQYPFAAWRGVIIVLSKQYNMAQIDIWIYREHYLHENIISVRMYLYNSDDFMQGILLKS